MGLSSHALILLYGAIHTAVEVAHMGSTPIGSTFIE